MAVGFLAAAGAAYGIGSGLFNYFQQKRTQDITWKREDTAVQRRVADLKAAGLSPTLAAGSSATTTATSSPQYNSGQMADMINAAKANYEMVNMREQNANMRKSRDVMQSEIESNEASAELKRAQATKTAGVDTELASKSISKMASDIDYLGSRTALTGQEMNKVITESQMLTEQLDYMKKFSMQMGSGNSLPGWAGGILGQSMKLTESLSQMLKEKGSQMNENEKGVIRNLIDRLGNIFKKKK